MNILILNTDYLDFLHWHYGKHPELQAAGYDEQLQARNDTLFGVADFYSHNLRALGHEARDIHVNNRWLQRAWALEAGYSAPDVSSPGSGMPAALARMARRAVAGKLRRLIRRSESLDAPPMIEWLRQTLRRQVEQYRPDIILNQAVVEIPSNVIAELRGSCRLMVGQIASPIASEFDLGGYDLMISSMPHFVERFNRNGIAARLHRFAFDPRVIERVGADRRHGIVFVGSLSASHESRIRLLSFIAERMELEIWGPHIDTLPKGSPLRDCHRGEAWGVDMYSTLAGSAITLNHHIDVAERNANNMRLFEATGVGTMLLTDTKDNLPELFAVGNEAVAYSTPEECAELAERLLTDENERGGIARRGQQRTLETHNYLLRMKELVRTLEEFI